MIPPALIDFSVWSNLARYPNDEIILLKGHLFLEVMLSEGLRLRTSLTTSEVKNMSFHAKVKALSELDEPMREAMEFALSLNKLRNMLAHEPFPKELEAALPDWAETVIAAYAMQKYQKYTRRTKITQAIAALAGRVYSLSYGGVLSSVATTNAGELTDFLTGRLTASQPPAMGRQHF